MTSRRQLQVIPAVDVLGDEAVRLHQGDYDRVTLNAGEPLELVARFAADRPPLIHLVDLSGARAGGVRPDLVAAAVKAAAGIEVQASGGIRGVGDAQSLLAASAARVVVGTAAFGAEDALAEFASALGDRLVVAIDVRDGRIATRGWREDTGLDVGEALARVRAAGVARVLCTAIARDGTLAGPDLALLERVVTDAHAPVLAAGGISSEADLDALAAIGVEGAIVGRALLEGRISVTTARTPSAT
jgi:phosphoribosylformimino-5-aminoimidazole carboxamide ribotide isomerase